MTSENNAASPRVGEDLLNGGPLGRILVEHPLDECLARVAQALRKLIRLQVQPLLAHPAIPCLSVIVPERRSCTQKDMQETSKTPYIDREAIRLTLEDFWSDVARSTDLEGHFVSWGAKLH